MLAVDRSQKSASDTFECVAGEDQGLLCRTGSADLETRKQPSLHVHSWQGRSQKNVLGGVWISGQFPLILGVFLCIVGLL